MRRLVDAFALCSTLILGAAAAVADDVGVVGIIASLEVNTTSADVYLQYHGRMIVNNSDGVLDEYRWGGTSCGNRVLTDAQVAALQAAQGNKKMTIKPGFQIGQGIAKCLVSYALVEKKNLKLFP